jgi:hypothetical protein
MNGTPSARAFSITLSLFRLRATEARAGDAPEASSRFSRAMSSSDQGLYFLRKLSSEQIDPSTGERLLGLGPQPWRKRWAWFLCRSKREEARLPATGILGGI